MGSVGYWPIFYCPESKTCQYGSFIMSCIFNKVLLVLTVAMFCVTVFQIYIYWFNHKLKGFRVAIYGVCALSLLNTFIHYGVISPEDKSRSFVTIELFRATIFFMICYYYCEKMTSLLTYKRQCMTFMRLFYFVTFAINFILAIVIWVNISKQTPGWNPEN